MANILLRCIVLTLLLAECLLGTNTDRSKRNDDSNNMLGNIAMDFLKIFSDIKNIRSTIPDHGYTNLTFEPEKARSLLEESANYKRTNIINPTDELRDIVDSEFLSKPFTADMLTDFQARHNDPLHKRHGVGEGLASLPESNSVDKEDEHALDVLNTALNNINNSNAQGNAKLKEESDLNNKNKTSTSPVDAKPANETVSKISSSGDAFDGTSKNTSTEGQTKESNEIKSKLEKLEKSEANDSASINQTLGDLKGLQSQINSMLDEQISNATKQSNTSNYLRPTRNMIFEAKIKGFLAKLDSFKFSDVGAQEKEDDYKLQKLFNETVHPRSPEIKNETSSISNNTKSNVNSTKPGITASNNSTSSANEEHKKEENNETSSSQHLASLKDENKNQLRRLPVTVKTDVGMKKDTIDAAFEPECSDKKKCPNNKYCRHFECFDCHHKHHECVAHEQCCDGMPCIYGRCDVKGKSSPGTICKNDADCMNGCCVLEPTINLETGICKIKLSEFHQCSPVLYRKVWIGDKKPSCGPCQDHLECVNKGVIATHLVCMKSKK